MSFFDALIKTKNNLITEAKFIASDRAVLIWVLVVLGLSTLSVSFGLAEVKHQHASIQRLIEADRQDRIATVPRLYDWGSAAYYNFHLTYDPPSDFAFAAMGQRDFQPWKHRIRMLALEGQIYERDVGNPVVALIGRFDFAFLVAFILPLVFIMLLYDLKASERTAGRQALLEATAGNASSFWFSRTSVRAGAIFFSVIIPLIIAGLVAGTAASVLVWAILFVFLYCAFWSLLCYFFSLWHKPGSLILFTLIGIWFCTAVIVPAGARLTIDKLVPIPSGAEILMLQRETVNDAWDLSREATMNPFFKRHSEWSDYQPVESSFEWQWYYAFQQVGDQKTEQLSKAYREGKLRRDRMANWVAFFTLPSLLERSLQSLAKTDLNSSIAYEEKVRAYHADLRAFYYPKFFRHVPFDKSELENLPSFDPGF